MNKKFAESRIVNNSESGNNLMFDFGSAERTAVVPIEFEYTGEEKDILGSKGMCGCTNVWCEGNKIKANLNLAAAVGKDQTKVVKTMKVFLGGSLAEPDWVYADEDKKLVKMNEKAPVILNLTIQGEIKDQPS